MQILEMIIVGIGIVVGLIILVILIAFLTELVKAFGKIKKDKDDKGGSRS